jgi:long-chain acyl-CoA synthetase
MRESCAAELLTADELAARASRESRAQLGATAVRPDDVASIVFTSGTTGGMKGVTLTHRNFMANMRSIRASIPFAERDRLVMVLPMHHAFPFVVAIVVGAAVGAEVTFENDLRRIRDRMAEVKPTLFLGVPALFELMYRNILHGIETQGRRESFERGLRIVDSTKQRTGINIGRIVFRELHKRLGGSLRFMVSGGAALNPQIARDFARLGVPIIQGWGMTEASPVLSVQRWSPRKFYMSNHYEEQLGTVGTALTGIEIGLIDVPEKELYVHLHGEGELVARGENVTPGYWQSPETSAAIKVGEWLRTGDVGRIDDEGNIWITGRSKFVIVLDSGEKVHPDEIEEKIARSPLVSDVVAIGRRVRGKTQTWAVVYPNLDELVERLGEGAMNEAAVRRAVRAEIDANERDVAPYKRVTDFMLTDVSLPKTALRKVARGQIADSYSFDVDRWQESWREYLVAVAAPTSDEPEEALTA